MGCKSLWHVVKIQVIHGLVLNQLLLHYLLVHVHQLVNLLLDLTLIATRVLASKLVSWRSKSRIVWLLDGCKSRSLERSTKFCLVRMLLTGDIRSTINVRHASYLWDTTPIK